MKQSNLAISIGLITGSILGSPVVWANPQGAQVVQGTASFSSPSTNVLNINNSRNAIINWQSFNIGAGQTTNFIQPSSTSSVLNRVITNNPSQILGNLNSNGQVFLINQHGILVGEGASINTAGFFGSTLNITDSDFLNGNLKFDGGGQGDFENQGYIHAGEDGSIILIAPNIQNGGVIEVDNGNIILAAGKSITITSLENSSIQFEVTSAENQITNLGQIVAKNGSASLFAGTLEHSGSIRATEVVQNADGSISLITQGDLSISDNAIVSADGDSGGNIIIQSELGTTLVSGDISATGSAGNGGS
ncbi:MAG: filamentous hemagglutinin N-terminal domain-containing protein, partial [Gammaproteobacteria bacterium]|nr:filamentous hemagglutinin N-terminal domain-containing protein [Gammaproteobacteria bacterium]